jgi:hypothetical protein
LKLYFIKKKEKKTQEKTVMVYISTNHNKHEPLSIVLETKNTQVKTTAETYDNVGHDVGQAQNVRR